jgi:cytidine deaminase
VSGGTIDSGSTVDPDDDKSSGNHKNVADIDWELLRREARAVMQRAYAPYSNFPVGAAAFADDGRLIVGCNVENASYGLSLCAECGLVSALTASGGGRLVAMVCVEAEGALLMPCGRCRQLLFEHGGPEMVVATDDGPARMSELLPRAFGPNDLAAAEHKAASTSAGVPGHA